MKGRALVLLLFAFALVPVASIQSQNFPNPVRISTNGDPLSVFVVDVNGDGLPDLLYETGGTPPPSMQTLLAQASGGYAPGPSTVMPPSILGNCRPVDVNRDGKVDLVCAVSIDDCDSQIETLLGNGDGTFQSATSSGLMHSTCGLAVFVPSLYTPADLNSDSFPDLMVGDAANFEMFVLLNDGQGDFKVSSAPNSVVQFGGEVYSADLNGDGRPDIFTNVNPSVGLGNGDGTFREFKHYGTYDSCNLYDLEADGHPDAVCANEFVNGKIDFALDVLHGNADGSFNAAPIASTPLPDGFAALESPTEILDVNGDGIPDILGASADGLSVLLGRGGQSFSPPVHYATGSFGWYDGTTSQIVDLNNDGYKDIICAGPGGIYISYGRKNGTYDAPTAFPVATVLGQMTMGDFNGDGIQDIAATGDDNIKLSFGKGDGTFQPPVAVPNGGISFAAQSLFAFNIAHGDFRGIGRQDILAIGTPGNNEYDSYVLFNNGDGTFSPPQELANSSVLWPHFEHFAVADFNGDGRDDFLIMSQDSPAFIVEISNGDGSFSSVTTALPAQANTSATLPVIADFDHDGKADLVFVEGANAYVLKGNGDGSFRSNPVALAIPSYRNQGLEWGPMAVTTGDFDGDGKLDFAVLAGHEPPAGGQHGRYSAVHVFYGNGDGTFSSPIVAGAYDEGYNTIDSSDLGKSGRSDIVLGISAMSYVGSLWGNRIGVVRSEEGRLFGAEADYIAGSLGAGLFVADLNGDGYPDLLDSNGSYWDQGHMEPPANSVTELLNPGPQTYANLQQSSTTLTASTQSFVAGDSVTFTTTVAGDSSSANTPTGSVRFADQTGTSSTVPLISSGSGSATATFTTSKIGVGSDTMGATYSGDSTFAPSSATLPLTVAGLPDVVTLTITSNPVPVGSGVELDVTVANPAGSSAAVPTGYVEFYDGSTIIAGPVTLTDGSTFLIPSFSTRGPHALSVWYSGDLTHRSNTSATQTETVLTTPNIAVSAPNSVTTAQVLSATIIVSGGDSDPIPTGSVSLTVSTTIGGSGYTAPAALLNNGKATISIPAGTLNAGQYWLVVTYTPDAASSSIYMSGLQNNAYISITVPPTFTVAGTNMTIGRGAVTGNTSTITLTPAGGFTGSVTLSAAIASAPAGAQFPPTFSFGSTSPLAIMGTNSVTATLTVMTTAASNSAYLRSERDDLRWCGVGSASLVLMLLLGRSRRQHRWGLRIILLLLAVGGLSSGCGGGGRGGGSGNSGTTAGTYTVTVTGTSGAISATSTITVTVQ